MMTMGPPPESGSLSKASSKCNPGDQPVIISMDFLLSTMRSKKVSMTTLHAVFNLYANQAHQVSLSGLSKNLGITTAAITSTADNLERLGFAKRHFSTEDRRNTFISLTTRGKVFADWFVEKLGSPLKDSKLDFQ